ncbi:MAG TPA: HAMP domain-containing sensor histidine kinase [Candidatus Thermoplasmatota archaeon]|nr:HAMP domain-containing sensor histidine kinase [Candidatus Thermoplasmatota archaeon]
MAGDVRSLEEPTQEELRRLNDLKTRFLNMAAHELNTPITPVRLQLHLLLSDAFGGLNPAQRKAVQIVQRNIDRLGALVQEILDVARLEGGGLRMRLEDVGVDDIVRDVWESYEEPARRVGIRLLGPAASGAVVHADRVRAGQILYNLLSNAIKFTPADGEIRVTVEPRSDLVDVVVRDTGHGMTGEQIAQLFRPFTRLHEELATGGSGLGLYIARGLAESMGGRLAASSPGPGKGTTFRLSLPAGRAIRAHVRPTTTPADDELARRLRQLI